MKVMAAVVYTHMPKMSVAVDIQKNDTIFYIDYNAVGLWPELFEGIDMSSVSMPPISVSEKASTGRNTRLKCKEAKNHKTLDLLSV